LYFSAAQRQNDSAGTEDYEVFLDSGTPIKFPVGSTDWVDQYMTFQITTAGSHKITFEGLDDANGVGNTVFFSDVRLSPV
jgi:hypothetical protein